MRDKASDQWMHAGELRLDPILQGVRGYVPLMSHVSFLAAIVRARRMQSA